MYAYQTSDISRGKAELLTSYTSVAIDSRHPRQFQPDQLRDSRNLFTEESIESRTPVPRDLDVVALLIGLPFPDSFIELLVNLQRCVQRQLKDSLAYWVTPEHFASEVCVLKWPADPWPKGLSDKVAKHLSRGPKAPFTFSVHGVQVHSDGCVVARTVDSNSTMRDLRSQLLTSFPNIPRRQSSWCHVPLGRILEPINSERLQALSKTTRETWQVEPTGCSPSRLTIVHEQRWYMEQTDILDTIDWP